MGKGILNFIIGQLSGIDGLSSRAMMGEYILYVGGKIVGGIYDDRLLVKPTESAKRLMPCASEEIPYDGAKPMLLVEDVDDRDFLKTLFTEIYADLPAPKVKNKR